MKIILISPYIIPRRSKFYTHVSKNINNSDNEIKFLLIKSKAKHRSFKPQLDSYGINYLILNSLQFYFKNIELAIDIPLNLFKELRKEKPQIIITEGFGFAYIPAIIYSLFFKSSLVFWNKSSSQSNASNSKIKIFIKKILISPYNKFIAGGKPQLKYLSNLGISDVMLYDDVPDLEPFLFNNIETSSNNDILKILFVGELIPRKNLIFLLNALNDSDFVKYNLTVVGDGPEMNSCITYAKENQLNVVFEGFKSPNEIQEFYNNSDCLIVPSLREAWGLVVEEGMASGLACIVSDVVGSKTRTIGYSNGFIYKSNNINSLREKVLNVSKNITNFRKMRKENSSKFQKSFNVKNSALSFSKLINKTSEKNNSYFNK